jgi:hypothetical protein
MYAAPPLQVLPAGEKFVFEFRDASWFCDEVCEVMKEHDWCLAITHSTGQLAEAHTSSMQSVTPASISEHNQGNHVNVASPLCLLLLRLPVHRRCAWRAQA